jgi:hypothetical protein
VIGRSTEVSDPSVVAQAITAIPDGWADGEHEDVFAISLDRVSGRRIHRRETGLVGLA